MLCYLRYVILHRIMLLKYSIKNVLLLHLWVRGGIPLFTRDSRLSTHCLQGTRCNWECLFTPRPNFHTTFHYSLERTKIASGDDTDNRKHDPIRTLLGHTTIKLNHTTGMLNHTARKLNHTTGMFEHATTRWGDYTATRLKANSHNHNVRSQNYKPRLHS